MDELSLFAAAIALQDSAERAALLDRECGANSDLRARLEKLLAEHDHSQAALDSPAFAQTTGFENEPKRQATADFRGKSEHAGTFIADKYTLVEPIGEGGMGSVWRARQTEPVKRFVAVKLIKVGMDSKQVLTRFEAERQALALMEHPNIAKVLDGGLHDGRPYFVMELVKGVPITDFCDARKLTPKERLELFVPVCQAIQHAHQKGIIHRDIKPSNVLVAMYDDKPVPKVIDFGVAKATGGTLTEATIDTGFGGVVGTPQYMSPEQATFNNLDIDTRSDVYALGILLYELLTGSPPFSRKELAEKGLIEILRVVREEEPPRPSTRLSTADALPSIAATRGTEPAKLTGLLRNELDWIVMKALEKDRTRRYETANGFAADIQRYLCGEPVLAHPPSTAYRIRKFIRRNKVQVIAACLVLAALLAGIAGTTWQAYRAEQARADEAEQRDVADQARDAEARARQKTEVALAESREKSAHMTYEKAQKLCEDGKADLGLHWMERSLEMMPPAARKLNRAVRLSMNLWASQLLTINSELNAPEWSGLRSYTVEDTVVSPDGTSLLLVDDKGNGRVYDLMTGKLRFELVQQQATEPQSIPNGAFSPDGQFVTIATGNKHVDVWYAATGKPIGVQFLHQAPVNHCCFAPPGNVLVTTEDRHIRFWKVQEGKPAGEVLPLEKAATGVDVSTDGRRLLAWNGDGWISVWDLATRKKLSEPDGTGFYVHWAGFSPDGKYVLANGVIKQPAEIRKKCGAQCWVTETGQTAGQRMEWDYDHAQAFPRACFHPSGGLAVTGGYPLRLWQIPSGTPVVTLASFDGGERPMFLPHGKSLVAFSRTGIHRPLLDLGPGTRPTLRIPLNTSDATGFFPSPGGRTATVMNRKDRTITFRFINLMNGQQLGEVITMEAPYYQDLMHPAYSPDGRLVATGVGKNQCQVWDTTTGQPHGPRLAMNSTVLALAFSPDGSMLAGGADSGSIHLWNTTTGKLIGQPFANPHSIARVCFSPDGRKLLTAGGRIGTVKGEARLWDVTTSQPIGPLLEMMGQVHDAAFSPDGKSFATGSFQLTLWSTETSKPLWNAPEFSPVMGLSFSPDGQLLLTRFLETNAVRLFETRAGTPASPHLRHTGSGEIQYAGFSPDGQMILTAAYDGSVRLWDTAASLPIGPPRMISHSATYRQAGDWARFTADGRGIWLSENGFLDRWDIPAPLDASTERIRLAIEAATRHTLDDLGVVKPLFGTFTPDPTHPRGVGLGPDLSGPILKRLQELGGPPGNFQR